MTCKVNVSRKRNAVIARFLYYVIIKTPTTVISNKSLPIPTYLLGHWHWRCNNESLTLLSDVELYSSLKCFCHISVILSSPLQPPTELACKVDLSLRHYNTSLGSASWRISYRRRSSVSKTRIAWARDRFYIYIFFFDSPTGQTCWWIFMRDSSTDVKSNHARMCLWRLDLNLMLNHYLSLKPSTFGPKPDFFRPKTPNNG